METLPDYWQDDLRALWEKTRRRGRAGSPLQLVVLWTAPGVDERSALIRSAEAEGGIRTSLEQWGDRNEATDISMRFTVAPTFAALNDLFLRLCHVTVTYEAHIRGLGLGRVNAVA